MRPPSDGGLKTSEEVKKLREEIFQQTNQIMNVVSENVKGIMKLIPLKINYWSFKPKIKDFCSPTQSQSKNDIFCYTLLKILHIYKIL